MIIYIEPVWENGNEVCRSLTPHERATRIFAGMENPEEAMHNGELINMISSEIIKAEEQVRKDKDAFYLQRQPSQQEMEFALRGDTERFYMGWTIRKCIDCDIYVAGGPTRCLKCVGKLEARQEMLAAMINEPE